MEQIGDFKVYTLEEAIDEDLGKIGTPRRDVFESTLETELNQYHIGEAIRQARKSKSLTQEQLGELMGVQRAQISRIEKGKNLNISTVSRAFKAMGVPASLALGGVSFPLW